MIISVLKIAPQDIPLTVLLINKLNMMTSLNLKGSLEQKIDLVLMDVVLGLGKDGLDAAKQIKQERPEVKILLVTSMPESTVKRHIAEMLAKTGFKSHLQLAIEARGGGLVIHHEEV